MTLNERKNSVIRVLISLEPKHVHAEKCSGAKNPELCKCYIFDNALMRYDALDDAGLLIPDDTEYKNETFRCNPEEMGITR